MSQNARQVNNNRRQVKKQNKIKNRKKPCHTAAIECSQWPQATGLFIIKSLCSDLAAAVLVASVDNQEEFSNDYCQFRKNNLCCTAAIVVCSQQQQANGTG